MFSLLVVLALENTRIHICNLNNSNVAFHIKGSVNKHFDRWAALKIPDINPANSYIQFRENFDYIKFRSNTNIVKNMSGLNNCFNHT